MDMVYNSLPDTSKEKLRQYVGRIETLEEEKAEVAGQIQEVYAEAKALGFDTKALRAAIRLRRVSEQERDEAQMMIDLYLSVLM